MIKENLNLDSFGGDVKTVVMRNMHLTIGL